jgi:putative ABC transport system ATP-binding protein
VLELLRAARDESGQTIVMVTHDPVAAGFADSVVVMADGRVAR